MNQLPALQRLKIAFAWSSGANASVSRSDLRELCSAIDAKDAEIESLRGALNLYANPCDATENSPCGYEGNLCCKTARLALNAKETP